MNLPQDLCILDFETFPWIAYGYGNHYEPVIAQEIEPSKIISIAYAFGDGPVKFKAIWDFPQKKGVVDDKPLIKWIAEEILPRINISAGHNVDGFDMKTLYERMMAYDMEPPKAIKTYDTLKILRKHAKNPSNKLGYVAPKYVKEGKLGHEGMVTYIKAGLGDKKSQAIIKKYNIQDTKVTRDLLKVILPWELREKPVWENRPQCPDCQSHETKRNGTRITRQGTFQEYLCNFCGRTFRSKQIIQKV